MPTPARSAYQATTCCLIFFSSDRLRVSRAKVLQPCGFSGERRAEDGGMPITRRKARLKEASDE